MHGIGVMAKKADAEDIRRFLAAANDLSQSIERLAEWSGERIAYNIDRLVLDGTVPVRLTEYLARIASASDPVLRPEAAFRALRRHLGAGRRPEDAIESEGESPSC